MNIELHKIKIRDLVKDFVNNEEDGVVGYNGRLNIRPKFQREFVYKDEQKKAVIDTVFKQYPLNVMYWVEKTDGSYELLDGQQRTLSICSYYAGEFFVQINNNLKGFGNLTTDEEKLFLDYELTVYICTNGTDSEQIEWFKVINIAGEKLTDQEILNAVYNGNWVTEAKRKFSKTGCVAYKLGNKYLAGNPIRQDYLHQTLKWISGGKVEIYMGKHQYDSNADAEWQYFQEIIGWIERLFPYYRKEMKGVDWGTLYNQYKDCAYSSTEMEKRIKNLMQDDDVTNKKGIYPYLLSGEERHLNIRTFTDNMKVASYERQKGICSKCGKHFELSEMEADHITPWSKGGKTNAENCQMLCQSCNRRKSDI